MEHLTKETFKEKVFNYENNKDWKFEGENPAIIDFYADWCGPCKMMSPVLEEISNEYSGKLDIYKIDAKTVLFIGKFHLKRTIGNIDGCFTLVWQKIEGEWVIVADHSSSSGE